MLKNASIHHLLSRWRLLPVCAVVVSLVLLGAGLVKAQPLRSGGELITYVSSPPSSPPTLRQAQDTALGGKEGGADRSAPPVALRSPLS